MPFESTGTKAEAASQWQSKMPPVSPSPVDSAYDKPSKHSSEWKEIWRQNAPKADVKV